MQTINLKRFDYDVKWEDQLSNLLADAYMANNPFIQPLNITRETMVEEFRRGYQNKTFTWPSVFLDADELERGNEVIVGTLNFGDLHDFNPPTNKDGSQIDFEQVPTNSLVRQYMRHKTLQKFHQLFPNVKKGECAYGSGMAIAKKYQGLRGLSSQLLALSLLYIFDLGYKRLCTHAINDLAKGVFRRLPLLVKGEYPVDVSFMFVQDTQKYPFKGLNLAQVIFEGYYTKDDLLQTIKDLNTVKIKPKL